MYMNLHKHCRNELFPYFSKILRGLEKKYSLVIFRASHYFISFMSEASAIAAGFGASQVTTLSFYVTAQNVDFLAQWHMWKKDLSPLLLILVFFQQSELQMFR